MKKNDEATLVLAVREAIRGEPPLHSTDNFLQEDATFQRFLRARDMDVGKATEMLKSCLTWRRSYKPHLVTAVDIKDILSLGTVFVSGTCRNGRPVLYMTPGAQNPYSAATRVQLMVFLMEQTMNDGHEKLTWIFDFSQMGKRAKDEESSKTRQEVIKILQEYYPERLGLLLLVNTPWYFRVIATLVWPFIDKRTRAKIRTDVKLNELVHFVAEDELLVSLGGKKEVRSDKYGFRIF